MSVVLAGKIDFFPTKLAKTPRFCNRVAEQSLLTTQIAQGRHTVLVSPRRYGKSSLVHKVVEDVGLPYAAIDLFLAHDEAAVARRILDCIGQLISQVMPKTQKALLSIQRVFNQFRVVLDGHGFSLLMATPNEISDLVEQIFYALKNMAALAAGHEKAVIFFIDEFQDIAAVQQSKAIQGAIRHVAQSSSHCVFIFSGSSRHLLLELFDDSNKPLYMLCDKLTLERMSPDDYVPYIQSAAQQHWQAHVDDLVLQAIFRLTEMHPFYVNLLCHALWMQDTVPSLDDVAAAWQACYECESRRIMVELDRLSRNQAKVLQALASAPTSSPSGRVFLNQVGLPLSSVRQALKTLLERDLVWLKQQDTEKVYHVLDPLLGYALRKYYV